MKKIALFITIIPILTVGLGVISMSKGNIEDIIICSANEMAHYMPSGVCESYLLNFRITREDIQYLEGRSGLAFLFDIDDKSKRDGLLEHFVLKGVSTNKPSMIDGYPPLHAAIINNDPGLVKFLLDNNADRSQKDISQNLTAKEFLDLLSRQTPLTDRSRVQELLALPNKNR